jgi:tetratricopeptide (TPR) repeat protein
LNTTLPQSGEHASRGRTTSNAGSYFATFVIGVLGFVVGNLALDAIKEQIHHDKLQTASQSNAVSPPPLATPSEPRPLATPHPAPTSTSARISEAELKSDTERSHRSESIGRQFAQVGLENPLALSTSLPAASVSLGPVSNPKSALEDTSAYTPSRDPANANAAQLNPKIAESYYQRGIAYGQNGNYDRAIADLTEAIRFNPVLTQAYYNRGVSYWRTGNHDGATADFNEAIRLDPKLAVAYYGRGCACLYYGQKIKADADFAQARRLGYTAPKPNSTNIFHLSLSVLGGSAPLQ